jgi:cobaltochelatase CobS
MTVKCEICGDEVHVIKRHLEENHPEVTIDQYRADYPNAPLLSDKAAAIFEEKKKTREKELTRALVAGTAPLKVERKPFHETFQIPETTPGALSTVGKKPIPISVYEQAPEGYDDLIPEVDPGYIFHVDSLKTLLIGLESNIPSYLVGHAGTGKSSLVEQASAFTKRACLRIQHTVNTEEAHILGQYTAPNGKTVWEPGPLQLAMKFGLTYLADEYDRGMPQVLSVYQPVLEGKPLVTKEAPPEWRIIKPHPDFRFVATGNTNGSGDETGLYPSTAIQDYANYERFNLMIEIDWMPRNQEIAVVAAQAKIRKEAAEKLVDFAQKIRDQVASGQMNSPISPRALIAAGKIGFKMGSFRKGVKFAYLNRLNSIDKEAGDQIAQRIFVDD